jgi:hypothetical protein
LRWIFLVLDFFNWLFIVGYVPLVKGVQVREKTSKIRQSSVDETPDSDINFMTAVKDAGWTDIWGTMGQLRKKAVLLLRTQPVKLP